MSLSAWYPPVRAPWNAEKLAAVDSWQDQEILHPLTCPVCHRVLERLRDVALRCPEGHYHQYWYPGAVLAVYRARMEHWDDA